MAQFIPFILLAVILWIANRGRKKISARAPNCPKCKIKMKYKADGFYRHYSGRFRVFRYRCPICKAEIFR